jgi:hypothetical protein
LFDLVKKGWEELFKQSAHSKIIEAREEMRSLAIPQRGHWTGPLSRFEEKYQEIPGVVEFYSVFMDEYLKGKRVTWKKIAEAFNRSAEAVGGPMRLQDDANVDAGKPGRSRQNQVMAGSLKDKTILIVSKDHNLHQKALDLFISKIRHIEVVESVPEAEAYLKESPNAFNLILFDTDGGLDKNWGNLDKYLSENNVYQRGTKVISLSSKDGKLSSSHVRYRKDEIRYVDYEEINAYKKNLDHLRFIVENELDAVLDENQDFMASRPEDINIFTFLARNSDALGLSYTRLWENFSDRGHFYGGLYSRKYFTLAEVLNQTMYGHDFGSHVPRSVIVFNQMLKNKGYPFRFVGDMIEGAQIEDSKEMKFFDFLFKYSSTLGLRAKFPLTVSLLLSNGVLGTDTVEDVARKLKGGLFGSELRTRLQDESRIGNAGTKRLIDLLNQKFPDLDLAQLSEVHGINEFRKGGIDMNAANLAMTIKRDGNGIPILSQQDLAQFSNIEGLDPVILSIKPASQTALYAELVAHL